MQLFARRIRLRQTAQHQCLGKPRPGYFALTPNEARVVSESIGRGGE